mmetsp:Transcript_14420/g.21401  ORF Transcript_14420/g.21401 Transcript_14420/m.21401 type:complete len:282 (+) Transcript_14420:54-899(+)
MKFSSVLIMALSAIISISNGFVSPPSMKTNGGLSLKISNFSDFKANISKIFSNGGNSGGFIGGNSGDNNNNNNGLNGFNVFDGNDGNNGREVLLSLAAMGVLGDIWTSYENALASNPILVKACTSLVGFSVGDFLAQKCISKSSEFDYLRLARMASFGFLFHGTVSHFFYNKLEEVIPGTTTLPVIKKVLTDQVLWAPIFTFVYLTYMGVTSGMNPESIGEKIKADLIKGVVGSWSVWPLVHAIGFKFVPLRQRLLYINCIQIGYNVFLSILGSNSPEASD